MGANLCYKFGVLWGPNLLSGVRLSERDPMIFFLPDRRWWNAAISLSGSEAEPSLPTHFLYFGSQNEFSFNFYTKRVEDIPGIFQKRKPEIIVIVSTSWLIDWMNEWVNDWINEWMNEWTNMNELFMYSFIHSFMYSFIHLLIYLFIYLFNDWLIN